MATWVEPIDSQTDPDAPLTSEIGKRWDYNVVAAFEGASGAPRLLGDAVATEINGLPVINVSAADTYSVDHGLGREDGATSTPDAEVVAVTYSIKSFTGSLRFRATLSSTGSAAPRLRLYKNSSLVYEQGSDGAYITDRNISPGDVIEWRIAEISGTTGSDAIISDISVGGDNAYVPQPVYIQAVNT